MRTYGTLTRLAQLVGLATVRLATPGSARAVASREVLSQDVLTEACTVGYCTQNGGTTGGGDATAVVVDNLAQFASAVGTSSPAIVVVNGALSGNGRIEVGSGKTIIGLPGSSLTGVGLHVKRQKNVIIRNLKVSKVAGGDAISLEYATNVWIDHCDLSSDMDHGKDYYDGLLDITHGSDWVSVTNTYFHDHYKTSLVSHSDNNAAEDTGKLHVTFASNFWENVNSRTPSIRFGTAHILNSLYRQVSGSGVNTRMGAKVLVESTVFEGVRSPVTARDSGQKGSAVLNDVSLGGGADDAPAEGGLQPEAVPYEYGVLGSGNVKDIVLAGAGQRMVFEI